MASKLSVFFAELKRRKVYRVAAIYAAVGVILAVATAPQYVEGGGLRANARSDVGRRMANHPSMAPKTISGPVSLGGGVVARVSSSDGVGATSEVWEKGRGWVDGASPNIELLLGRGSGRQ